MVDRSDEFLSIAERSTQLATLFLRKANNAEQIIAGAGVEGAFWMDPKKKEEQTANERRRHEALHIIAELQRRKRQNRTNEMLLDQEALRQAALRAGLEEGSK